MEINYWQSLQPLLEGLLKDMVEEETKYPLDSKISSVFNQQGEMMIEQSVEKWLSQTRLTFRKINFLSNFTKTINDLKKQTSTIKEIQKNFEQIFQTISPDHTLDSECSRLNNAMKKICQTTLSSKTLIPKTPLGTLLAGSVLGKSSCE